MSGTQTTLLWIYAGIIAIWPIRLIVLTMILRRQEFLTLQSPRYDQPEPPLISAILPAKDEEVNLADCLASVCRQSYPNLEIMVVDDRSIDRNWGNRSPIRGGGSSHPCAHDRSSPGRMDWQDACSGPGRYAARGEWLWFLDADTLHAPEGLAILMEYARTARRIPGEPAARAALRDLLGAGRAAARRHRLDAVVPACNESITSDLLWPSPMASTS